jgi:hypothetical protein
LDTPPLGVVNVGIALWLNIWNRDFFNALEKRDVWDIGTPSHGSGSSGSCGVQSPQALYPSAVRLVSQAAIK